MTPAEYCSRLAALREKVKTDSDYDEFQAQHHLSDALELLNEMAAHGGFHPAAVSQIKEIRRSLLTFYAPGIWRSWAQQLIVNDLQFLEDLCRFRPDVAPSNLPKPVVAPSPLIEPPLIEPPPPPTAQPGAGLGDLSPLLAILSWVLGS